MVSTRDVSKAFFTVAALAALTVLGAIVPRPATAQELFVSDILNNSVQEFNGATGVFERTFVAPGSGGLFQPFAMAFGPDGNLYIANGDSTNGAVLRYDGTTGAFIDAFTSGGPTFTFRQGMTFGPDGNLYVSTSNGANTAGSVLRYNGTTGAFIDSFVPSGNGGLGHSLDLTFGPDGNLYVASDTGPGLEGDILRYNGTTGAFIDDFVPSGVGGMAQPIGLTFGPDDNLYVSTDNPTNSVLRYNGTTGAPLGAFVPTGSGGLENAYALTFGPDGDLLVSSNNNGGTGTTGVLRYSGTTGAFEGTFASTPTFSPGGLLFRPASPSAVPEPGSLTTLGLGLLSVGALTLRRRWAKR